MSILQRSTSTPYRQHSNKAMSNPQKKRKRSIDQLDDDDKAKPSAFKRLDRKDPKVSDENITAVPSSTLASTPKKESTKMQDQASKAATTQQHKANDDRPAKGMTRDERKLLSTRMYKERFSQTTEHTIPLAEWNKYFDKPNRAWGKALHHKIWEKCEIDAHNAREKYIGNTKRLTAPDHVYYLCIPVKKRPPYLPFDPHDCSSYVLEAISNILEKLNTNYDSHSKEDSGKTAKVSALDGPSTKGIVANSKTPTSPAQPKKMTPKVPTTLDRPSSTSTQRSEHERPVLSAYASFGRGMSSSLPEENPAGSPGTR